MEAVYIFKSFVRGSVCGHDKESYKVTYIVGSISLLGINLLQAVYTNVHITIHISDQMKIVTEHY